MGGSHANRTECLVTEFDRDPIWFRFVNRPASEGVPRLNARTPPFIVDIHQRLKAQGISLTLQIPMVTSGRVSGFIGIRFTKRREFPPEEIDLSRALAHQAALAMRLMRLSRESQQTAVMAERNRLARDIHGHARPRFYRSHCAAPGGKRCDRPGSRIGSYRAGGESGKIESGRGAPFGQGLAPALTSSGKSGHGARKHAQDGDS